MLYLKLLIKVELSHSLTLSLSLLIYFHLCQFNFLNYVRPLQHSGNQMRQPLGLVVASEQASVADHSTCKRPSSGGTQNNRNHSKHVTHYASLGEVQAAGAGQGSNSTGSRSAYYTMGHAQTHTRCDLEGKQVGRGRRTVEQTNRELG